MTTIDRNKQIKIKYKIKAQEVPFGLPKMSISYRLDEQNINHTLTLPLSFNKFITYHSDKLNISRPISITSQL